MAIETPPPITPVPTPVIQRGDPTTFSDRVDLFVTWLEGAPPEFGDVADNVEHNATEAQTKATAAAASAATATTQATTATTQAGIATTQAGIATTQAGNASTSATAAAASAASAAAIAGAFVGTSTSSLTIGTGNKTFATQGGEQYTPGITMTAVSQANTANWMAGQVVSYNSGTGALVINVTATGGSGTFADWNLSLAGVQGPQGVQGTPGALAGTATGAINWNGTVTLASASTVNIGAAASNDLIISGSTTVNAFDTIAAGATRKVKSTGTWQLTFNASTMILPGLANIITAPDDTMQFTSLGGGAWICDWYKRATGKAISEAVPFNNIALVETSQTWNTRVAGVHRVTVVGGSGSGAAFRHLTVSGKACGAGAGGLARKSFNASAGQGLVITIGAGGAAVTRSTDGGTSGNNGGATTLTTTGVSVTANGGDGGVFVQASAANTPATGNTAGGAGGTASGGDTNYTGGAGGPCHSTGTLTSCVASGGGAVNWYGGTPYAGGEAQVLTSTKNRCVAAGGGAGLGGKGGGAYTNIDDSAGAGSGASTHNPGTDAQDASGAAAAAGVVPIPIVMWNFPSIQASIVGGTPANASDGCGGSASAAPWGGSGSVGQGAPGGRFGGGGATASTGFVAAGTTSTAGAGKWGGGGAGVALSGAVASGTVVSGAGDHGVVLVEYAA